MKFAIPLLSVALLQLACGQSGTEGSDSPAQNCVCDQSYSEWALRGNVVSANPLEVEVLEIFADLPRTILAVGDRIGGATTTQLPCDDTGALQSPGQPAMGSEVLVLMARGNLDSYPECAEYKSCTATTCGPMPGAEADPTSAEVLAWDQCDGACVTDTRTACQTHRGEALLASEMLVLPWTEGAHYFGQIADVDINLSTTELSAIGLAQESCQAAIPDAMTTPPPLAAWLDLTSRESPRQPRIAPPLDNPSSLSSTPVQRALSSCRCHDFRRPKPSSQPSVSHRRPARSWRAPAFSARRFRGRGNCGLRALR